MLKSKTNSINYFLFFFFNFFLIFSIFTSKSYCQQTRMDSLAVFVDTTSNDSSRALVMLKLAFYYIFNDKEKAIEYIDKAMTISEEKNIYYGIVNAYGVKGIYFDVQGISDSAFYNFNKSLELSRKYKFVDMELKQLNNLGMYYRNKGLGEKAIEYFYKVLEQNEKVEEKNRLEPSILYNNIGLIYQENILYEKALKNHLLALKYRRENPKLSKDVATSLNNIGICYRHLNKFDDAIKVFKEGLSISKNHEFLIQYCSILSNLSHVYTELHRYNEALALNLEKLKYEEKGILDDKSLMSLNAAISGNYIQLGNNKKALEFSKKALNYLEKNSELAFYAFDTYKNASYSFYLNGNPDKGLKYALLNEKLSESMFTEKHAEKLAELENDYEVLLKENEILNLRSEKKAAETKAALSELEKNRKTRIIYIIIALSILILGGVGAWYRWKQLEERNKIQAELQNAMFMSEQNERVRIARDLHDSIGQKLAVQKMMLNSLKITNDEAANETISKTSKLTDETIVEVRNISHNLIPEELNLGLIKAIEETIERIKATNEIDVILHISEENQDFKNIELAKQLSIYRIVQEILSNMLKHAKATIINIDISAQNHKILLEIKDNGKGFNAQNLSSNEGIGWKNIITRTKILSGELKIKSQPSFGTQIQLYIPS
jgi:signal transduction histidine kinase